MSACEPLTTSVSRIEALCILEPFYLEAQQLFLDAGFELVRRTRFAVGDDLHDTARHFAACRDDGELVLVAPELVELPVNTVVAILAHELGHACDFLYPARFQLTENGVSERALDNVSERQRLRWLSAWQQRDEHVIEVTADRLAELVYGAPIGYAGPCLLQTFRGGEPRPEELR